MAEVQISIHTPARGVTYEGKDHSENQTDFNPHSREGSDVGADILQQLITDFNPHSREGSDVFRHIIINI